MYISIDRLFNRKFEGTSTKFYSKDKANARTYSSMNRVTNQP